MFALSKTFLPHHCMFSSCDTGYLICDCSSYCSKPFERIFIMQIKNIVLAISRLHVVVVIFIPGSATTTNYLERRNTKLKPEMSSYAVECGLIHAATENQYNSLCSCYFAIFSFSHPHNIICHDADKFIYFPDTKTDNLSAVC